MHNGFYALNHCGVSCCDVYHPEFVRYHAEGPQV